MPAALPAAAEVPGPALGTPAAGEGASQHPGRAALSVPRTGLHMPRVALGTGATRSRTPRPRVLKRRRLGHLESRLAGRPQPGLLQQAGRPRAAHPPQDPRGLSDTDRTLLLPSWPHSCPAPGRLCSHSQPRSSFPFPETEVPQDPHTATCCPHLAFCGQPLWSWTLLLLPAPTTRRVRTRPRRPLACPPGSVCRGQEAPVP